MKITSKFIAVSVTIALCMAVTLLARAQDQPSENLQTRLVVKQGHDILIRLNYDGGVKGWDAAFGYHGKIVTVLNSGFITILDPDGDIATPRKGKLISSWVNTPMKHSFDIVINLAKVYDMSIPGRYIIEWGCKNIRSQVIYIDVIRGISSNDGVDTKPPSQQDTPILPKGALPKFN